MKFTYYGHACFGVEIDDTHILFDPFISPNELAAGVDIDSIPADFILITHGHGDHVADVERIANRTGASLISNFEIVSWFEQKGIKGHPMNHGGSWEFPFGKVKYVNAVHSSTLPDGSPGGNPGGFVVSTKDKIFYNSGDTALTYDMKLIAEEFDLDLAILCLGDNFTMGYEDAAKAADFIGCNNILGQHFDTFGYIKVDHQTAVDHFAKSGKKLHLLPIGGSLEI